MDGPWKEPNLVCIGPRGHTLRGARVAESADATDLKSVSADAEWGFESPPGHSVRWSPQWFSPDGVGGRSPAAQSIPRRTILLRGSHLLKSARLWPTEQ